MGTPLGRDFLTTARRTGAALMVLGAVLAFTGSFLDWVTITPPPEVPRDQLAQTQPFTGVDARDGWLVVGASGVLMLLALGVVARARSVYGWLGFFTAMFIGSIAIADYRGLDDFSSAISQRMDIVGDATAAAGLILVGIAAGVALIGSLVAIAASPPIHRSE